MGPLPARQDILEALIDAIADAVHDRLRQVIAEQKLPIPRFVTVAHEARRRGLSVRELKATCRRHGIEIRREGRNSWVCPDEIDQALNHLPKDSASEIHKTSVHEDVDRALGKLAQAHGRARRTSTNSH